MTWNDPEEWGRWADDDEPDWEDEESQNLQCESFAWEFDNV